MKTAMVIRALVLPKMYNLYKTKLYVRKTDIGRERGRDGYIVLEKVFLTCARTCLHVIEHIGVTQVLNLNK